MNPFEALAGAISDLADSAEDAVAGGDPPAYVVQQSVERARQIAYAAAMTARGRITPDDLGGMLGRPGTDDTLMLGRPGVKPPERHRGLRAVRQVLGRLWPRSSS